MLSIGDPSIKKPKTPNTTQYILEQVHLSLQPVIMTSEEISHPTQWRSKGSRAQRRPLGTGCSWTEFENQNDQLVMGWALAAEMRKDLVEVSWM